MGQKSLNLNDKWKLDSGSGFPNKNREAMKTNKNKKMNDEYTVERNKMRRKAFSTSKRGPVLKKQQKSLGNKKPKFFESRSKLPMGTLEPVEKWQSCRLRVRIGRCPNISVVVGWLELEFEDFWAAAFPESPMSISLTNHFKGLVSTIGEVGVDWMAVKRSIREPKP